VPDDTLSLKDGVIAPWATCRPTSRIWFARRRRKFCRIFPVTESQRLCDYPSRFRRILLDGTNESDEEEFGRSWQGVYDELHSWWKGTESHAVRDWLDTYMDQSPCEECRGDRLRIEALSVFVESSALLPDECLEVRKRHGLDDDPHRFNIADFVRLTITQALELIGAVKLSKEQQQIAEPILREIKARLGFMEDVGLEYLSLDRRVSTLSGGEAQRIRLATQVGSGLVGVCYVLDEPTIGLHQRDNDRLIGTLRHLADIGNTVLVVEHDEEMIRAADQVLDLGPGPGVHGGKVVAQGTVDEVMQEKKSLTGQFLAGRLTIDVPDERRELRESRCLKVKGARENNLKNIDVAFPLGGVICVTGVSGSGKSTLVNEILLKGARRQLTGSPRIKPGAHSRITGLNSINRLIEVDQSPIGRTPRSNPATYTGFFDDVRKIFTKTKEARIRGYKPGRFSFNVKGGRCEACQGQGVKRIEMHFLPDVFVECEACRGARYNRETLEVMYRGKTIADVLSMTVEEACSFFENHPAILRFAECLRDVGLGYIELGQPSTTLSGGEAQRVKLATELGKQSIRGNGNGNTLYILDEPTTGLHYADVKKLLHVFDRLANAGNTLIVIEHNLDVIKRADWIIDLGPEGGEGGGTVVAEGTPEDVAKVKYSYTGQYLKQYLGAPTRREKKRAVAV
jgi:excinuclease ABC subunit A